MLFDILIDLPAPNAPLRELGAKWQRLTSLWRGRPERLNIKVGYAKR
jgi:hypothetical protein